MATQSLYRAWRPERFADTVGQDAIITTLKNQVASGRVAHAYLFCGSRGTGKTTTAKILARAVNCETPEAGDPCGHCPTCLALAAESNLDIVEIDAASNNGVDEIRDLRDKIKYPPQHGRYRVYIIDEVHMLSTGAFNALLKTLEEPPAHAIFILATTEPRRLPATVLSRCQRYDFRRFPAQVIVDRLRTVVEGERAEATPAALLLIARAAEGGMRDALSLLDMCIAYGGGSVDDALVREVLGAADRRFLFTFAGQLIQGDTQGALRSIDALMRAGHEPQVFARDITQHLRALLLSLSSPNSLADLLEITQEDADEYVAQGQEASRERLLLMLDLFMAAETDMRWSSQPRTALEVACVRCCLPEDALRLDALLARVDMLEKKIAQGAAPAPARPAGPVSAAPAPSPARSPAKKAAPPNPAPSPIGDGKSVWEKALAAIKKEPYLYAPITQGKFLGIAGGTARLCFPKGGEIFLNMLSQAERKEKIEAILSESAGAPVALALGMEGDMAPSSAPPSRQGNEQNVLSQVFDLFGRENVQVVDEE